MNKEEKMNPKSVIDKKRSILIEENNILSELKDKILQELGKLQVNMNRNRIKLF